MAGPLNKCPQSSDAQGGFAPVRDTVIAATLAPKAAAWVNSSIVAEPIFALVSKLRASRLAKNPALNVSPAPTVSTTCTLTAGTSTEPSRVRTVTPLGPLREQDDLHRSTLKQD